MNIFILDLDIDRCAKFHCDQHVSKMILESAQLMCTAMHKKGFHAPYRPTHAKHPCVLWVEESHDNFLWLGQLARALNSEYRRRYEKDKDHASIQVLDEIQDFQFESRGLTPFAQAMPDRYKVPDDPVAAYRAFYLGEKNQFATWTRCPEPCWWQRTPVANKGKEQKVV
jgi:hypothetical protein